MTQLAIENAPTFVVAIAGVVVAIVLLVLRFWLAGTLVGLASVLTFLASLLSVAFGVVIPLLLTGILGDATSLVENVYLGGESVIGTVGTALLVIGAGFAIRGRRPRGRHPLPRHFGVGLAAACVVSLVATVLLAGATAMSAPRLAARAVPTPTPTPSLGPGTLQAGNLRAPQTLGGEPMSPPTDAKEAAEARQARDDFSKALGGAPSIHATYGLVTTLDAGQGYISADDYFAGSKVEYSTYGQVRCGNAGASICIRSDPDQKLTVVVSDLAQPAQVASMVDEAWKDEGGH